MPCVCFWLTFSRFLIFPLSYADPSPRGVLVLYGRLLLCEFFFLSYFHNKFKIPQFYHILFSTFPSMVININTIPPNEVIKEALCGRRSVRREDQFKSTNFHSLIQWYTFFGSTMHFKGFSKRIFESRKPCSFFEV